MQKCCVDVKIMLIYIFIKSCCMNVHIVLINTFKIGEVDHFDSSNSASAAQNNLRLWLKSPALLQAVVTSMAELQECLHDKKNSCKENL